jgi:hypothetical protein
MNNQQLIDLIESKMKDKKYKITSSIPDDVNIEDNVWGIEVFITTIGLKANTYNYIIKIES